MKRALLFLSIILTNNAFTQIAADSNLRKPRSAIDNKFFLFVNPTACIDPWDGLCYRIGAEHKISHRFSFLLEGGQYFYSQPSWAQKQNISGFVIKPMIKYYLNKKGIDSGYYLGFEYMYKRQAFTYEDSISINNSPPYDKKYTISRYVTCLTFKYGCVINFKHSRFLYDYFIGLGVRFKSSTSNLSAQEEDNRLFGEGHGDLIGDGERALGNLVLPNFVFGIKIGYRGG